MPVKTHKYSNGEVTVIWKPDLCIHSTLCWKGLPSVFNPRERPWIKAAAAGTEQIIDQVRKCPSGALSYAMNETETTGEKEVQSEAANMLNIEALPNGPLLVKTDCMITYGNGSQEIKKGVTALCRCGASNNKPYCDGTHNKINFQG